MTFKTKFKLGDFAWAIVDNHVRSLEVTKIDVHCESTLAFTTSYECKYFGFGFENTYNIQEKDLFSSKAKLIKYIKSL